MRPMQGKNDEKSADVPAATGSDSRAKERTPPRADDEEAARDVGHAARVDAAARAAVHGPREHGHDDGEDEPRGEQGPLAQQVQRHAGHDGGDATPPRRADAARRVARAGLGGGRRAPRARRGRDQLRQALGADELHEPLAVRHDEVRARDARDGLERRRRGRRRAVVGRAALGQNDQVVEEREGARARLVHGQHDERLARREAPQARDDAEREAAVQPRRRLVEVEDARRAQRLQRDAEPLPLAAAQAPAAHGAEPLRRRRADGAVRDVPEAELG